MVVAAPALLRRDGVPRHPRELQQANCIRILSGRTAWGDFQENGRSFQVPVSGNLAFNHIWPAVQACAEGVGFVMFFSYQVEPLVAEGRLRIVLEEFELPPRPHPDRLSARPPAAGAHPRLHRLRAAGVTRFRRE